MFRDIFDTYDWDTTLQSIYAKTANDVERALNTKQRTLEDFKAMLSPAALPYLEQMAQMSHAITQKRFGKTIQLYAPMYVSNECQNICNYCGFSFDNKLKRRTLSGIEIVQEAAYLKSKGFRHILVVSGEAEKTVGLDYFVKTIQLLRNDFPNISLEVQPLEEEEYRVLVSEGLYAILVYQETYHKDRYRDHHLKGRKSNFYYRLDTPDRLGKAGIHKIGLGVLIGLEDWRTDNFFTALHLNYLEKQYWQTKYSISFPRLRPAEGLIEPKVVISDKELVQLICAWRIFNEELELSISTRESERFRNNIIKLGVTTMSAGSRTNPGGYTVEEETLEQFEINDDREVDQVCEMITGSGYRPVWKDWDEFALTPQMH
jgi:2-iminoacetate synthase